MTKIYNIIHINSDLSVVVDKEAKIERLDWFINMEFKTLHQYTADVTQVALAALNNAEHLVKIIATVNKRIEGLPFIQLQNESESKLTEDVEIFKWLEKQGYQTEYEETGEYKMYFSVDMPKILRDYKAQSKGMYTEEDIDDAIMSAQKASSVPHYDNNDNQDDILVSVKFMKQYLQSLQKKLSKSVELEMEEYNARPDLGDFLTTGSEHLQPLIMQRIKITPDEHGGIIHPVKINYE